MVRLMKPVVGVFTVIFAIAVLFLQIGCTKSEMAGRAVSQGESGEPGVEKPDRQAGEDIPVLETEIYDLEEELEDNELDEPEDVEEKIEPIKVDTFSIKDVSGNVDNTLEYDLGYRIQVFASSELQNAKELKKKVMAGTGLAVYIEYEGGLYKVRAGDFLTREEAARARARLVELYPDCWIVKTTIVK